MGLSDQSLPDTRVHQGQQNVCNKINQDNAGCQKKYNRSCQLLIIGARKSFNQQSACLGKRQDQRNHRYDVAPEYTVEGETTIE